MSMNEGAGVYILHKLLTQILYTLKYLILLLYYLIVDGLYCLISNELLDKQQISGKKALICGVNNEISKQLAYKLGRANVYLILWDESANVIEETLELLRGHGINRVRGYVVNLLSRDDVLENAEDLTHHYGEIDFIFNNMLESPSLDSPKSLYNVINVFLPAALSLNKGHFITLNSIFGLFGCSDKMALSSVASSYAVKGIMDSLRLSIKHTNIKTTMVYLRSIKENSCECTSWLFPHLDADFVTHSIIEAVEIGQEMLILPKFVYFIQFIKNITPTRFSDLLFYNDIETN